MHVLTHYIKYLRPLLVSASVLAVFYFLLRMTPASEAVPLPTNDVTVRQTTEQMGALNRLSIGGLAEFNHYYLYHDLLINTVREPVTPVALMDGHKQPDDKGRGL